MAIQTWTEAILNNKYGRSAQEELFMSAQDFFALPYVLRSLKGKYGMSHLPSGRTLFVYRPIDREVALPDKGDLWMDTSTVVDENVPASICAVLSVWTGDNWVPMNDAGMPVNRAPLAGKEIELAESPDENRGIFKDGRLDGETLDFFVAPWEGGDGYEKSVPDHYVNKYIDRAGRVHSELYKREISPWDDGPQWLFTLFEDRLA